ncbi:hypothetical protein PHYPSEUDO_005370 [Phytophthora pseudosyringae]|uniref:HTH psq-type domain-containing protein n=1 Tax=Phytophthora pseudosyringae TaxID=221518 RepID=A0A8T1VPA9_9STRA|nr:hypothetical protein PHYPSEUDO_005370 [Phytophthora pseudosyringae]
MPPTRQVQEHESALEARQQPPRQQPTALILSMGPPPLTGLSAFADSQLPEMRSSLHAASPSTCSRSSRWSPYAAASLSAHGTIASEPIGVPWGDVEDEGAQQNHRRGRTSPRRRLAASKARARAMQMAMEGEQAGYLDRFDGGYRLQERSYEATPFMPSLPMSMPVRPPSPAHVDESGIDASPSKKSSRYLREVDRRTILARLDGGETQAALAKEFRVTRAAICNLNKHRDLVLSRQHENPLARHPKKS